MPITRISGKKKRKQKEQRKRFILSFKLFDIIENIVDETLCSKWSDNEFFNEFVEVKNLNIVDENKYLGVDLANGKDFSSTLKYGFK